MLTSNQKLMIGLGLVVVIILAVVAIVYAQNEGFAQSPLGAIQSSRYRSEVDYQHDPASNPHLQASMSSYYKPMSVGSVDFEQASRALETGTLFDDLRNDRAPAHGELLPADERSQSQLIREGSLEKARRMIEARLARAFDSGSRDPFVRRPTTNFE